MRRKVIGVLHLGLSLLGEKSQKEAEIERLRGQLEDERRDLDEARAELARLRDQTTPRIYKEGDPVPGYMVWWWNPKPGAWRRLRGDLLDPGDLWLPMPPPPPSADGK